MRLRLVGRKMLTSYLLILYNNYSIYILFFALAANKHYLSDAGEINDVFRHKPQCIGRYLNLEIVFEKHVWASSEHIPPPAQAQAVSRINHRSRRYNVVWT